MTDKLIGAILGIVLALCLLALVMLVAVLGKMTWLFILQ